MPKVKVYYFTQYDIRLDGRIASKRPATLQAIKALGCQPIEESAVEVETHQLDADGFLARGPA